MLGRFCNKTFKICPVLNNIGIFIHDSVKKKSGVGQESPTEICPQTNIKSLRLCIILSAVIQNSL
jgi:hypothetical protein